MRTVAYFTKEIQMKLVATLIASVLALSVHAADAPKKEEAKKPADKAAPAAKPADKKAEPAKSEAAKPAAKAEDKKAETAKK